MPLTPGTRLGPYEILCPIGAGGMGEVYRARDTRLDRTVAIKVLAENVASRPELRQRFEREARAVSSLNHPHICSLYDVGQQDGQDYLVMEYLEGETLAARLAKGALPLDQLLRFAVQMAGALSQAHRQGVFHRDLKPGNVMLTKTGVKLLDFGLAKLRLPEKPGPLTALTTVMGQQSTLTAAGVIIGTLHYMAPEQLEGKEADGRTDVFAFGAVLYEMTTGRKAFDGKTPASLIAAILSLEPAPVSSLVSGVARLPSPALDRVIRRCLAKNPDDRWQSSEDLASELQWIAEAGYAPPAPAAEAAPAKRRLGERAAWVVAATATLAALLLLALYLRPAAPTRAVRFFVSPPEKTTLEGSVAVSPDGNQLAFVSTTPEGNTSLWVRPLDALEARLLPGTEGAIHPFWSPDSRLLGFFADGKLKKIRVDGGPPQALCDVFHAQGGTWNRDGVIVFARDVGDRLYRIADTGAAFSPATTLNPSRQESSHQWPQFLPDGRHFLLLVWSAQADARGIYIGSLDSPDTRRLTSSDWAVRFGVDPGHRNYLFFLRGRTLMAQGFDPSQLQLSGEPFPVAEQVWYDETVPGLASISLADNGVLAYRSGGIRSSQLIWLDRNGKPLGAVGPPGPYRDPWLSPDERRIAVARIDPQTGTQDVWLLDSSRGSTASRFTFQPGDDVMPLWSPDGSRIVYAAKRDRAPDLYEKSSSGGGSEKPLLESPVSKYPTDWSRDGRYIVYANWDDKTKWDLWILPMFADRKPIPYLQSEFNTFQAQFSPDDRWIAYTSNETNRYEVYVQPFPMSGGKWPISINGGSQPHWRRDGKELFYLAPDRKLMALPVKIGRTFEAGTPRTLFQTQITDPSDTRNHYVVSADGQRFLINSIVQDAGSSSIAVAVNWAAGLKP